MSTSDSSHSDASDQPGRESSESGGQTETRTTESTQTDHLTKQEEKVVRMRRGLAEGDDHELEFGVGADEATADKLAQLEAFLVEAFDEQETGERYLADAEYGVEGAEKSSGDGQSETDTKQKIIDELSDD